MVIDRLITVRGLDSAPLGSEAYKRRPTCAISDTLERGTQTHDLNRFCAANIASNRICTVFCPANYVIAADLKPSCFKLRDRKNAVGEPRFSIGTHFEFDACPAFFVGFRPGRGFRIGMWQPIERCCSGSHPALQSRIVRCSRCKNKTFGECARFGRSVVSRKTRGAAVRFCLTFF